MLPDQVHAILDRATQPAPRVIVDVDASRRGRVESLVRAWGYEPIASAADEHNAIARLRIDTRIEVLDESGGRPCASLYGDGTRAIMDACMAIRRIERWRRIRRRICGSYEAARQRGYELELGLIRDRRQHIAPDDGVNVYPGDEVFVSVCSERSDPCFCSVFRVLANRQLLHWTRREGAGVPVVAGPPRVITAGPYQQLQGRRVGWPTQLPRSEPVEEFLLVVIADGPMSMHSLETGQVIVPPAVEAWSEILDFGPSRADTIDFFALPYTLHSRKENHDE